MTDGTATLHHGAVPVADCAAVQPAPRTGWRRPPYLPGGHALVPGDGAEPLRDVLRYGLGGATVPVRPGPRDELFVGYADPRPGRTVRRLVIQPIIAQVARRGGRVHPAQRRPFELVLRFVGPERDAVTLLRAYLDLNRQLRDHALVFTRYAQGLVTPAPVTVLVAGTVDVRGLLADEPRRYAFADGTLDDVGSPDAPPSLVPALGEPWSRRFGWDGREDLPAIERHLLHGLVAEAHREGRTVRLSALPARPRRIREAFRAEVRAAGVDAIADSDLRALARYLRGEHRVNGS